MFAIEEGASYINHSTLWRVAMSAITSYFVLNIASSVIKGFAGQMSNGGLISFGEFDDASYNFFQLIIFAVMGVSVILTESVNFPFLFGLISSTLKIMFRLIYAIKK